MKRVFLTGIFFLAAYIGVSAAVMKDLKQGETLKMNLKFSFSEDAKQDGAFVTWELAGDWDKFDYKFSQGKLKDNILTIEAADYKEFANGEDGVALIIAGKKKTEDATYNLVMKVKEVSANLDFPKNKMNLDLNVHYILPPPTPWWMILAIIGGVFAVLGAIVALILNVAAKFPKGLLQIGREEVYLKGKKQVSVRKELEKVGIELEGTSDVVFDKKRFGSFQGPRIKQMTDCTLERDGEFVSRGSVLLPTEELKGLKDVQGNEIIIRYC